MFSKNCNPFVFQQCLMEGFVAMGFLLVMFWWRGLLILYKLLCGSAIHIHTHIYI